MTPEDVEARSRARARANQRRIYIIGAFVVLALLALAFNLQRQQTALGETQRLMCAQRQANIIKANSNWDALTEIERRNKFIDADVRNARLRVFANAKLIVPDCKF
jgi:hypothetical protein